MPTELLLFVVAADEVIAGLEQRLAEWTKLPLENGEPLHVLHYQKGEQYTGATLQQWASAALPP